jgi:dihydrolipoamide dehydrogenase
MVMGEIQEGVDVVVIGAGPGGYVAAIRAAQLGREVHLVEAMDRLGGVCLNWGCIPSKALIHVANLFSDIGEAGDLGISIDHKSLDLRKTQAWKNEIIKKLSKGIEQLCRDNKITIHRGIAHFKSKDSIMIEGEETSQSLKFKNAIVATGSHAIELPGLPFAEAKGIVSAKGALSWSQVPKKLVVVGAGYIGTELGTVFSKFGSDVTIVEALDRILPEIDADIAKPVERKLKKLGVTTILGAKVQAFDGRRVELEGGEGVSADKVLISVGRNPNTDKLSLEQSAHLCDRGCSRWGFVGA